MNVVTALIGIRKSLAAIEKRVSVGDVVKLMGKRKYTINRNRKPSILKIKGFLDILSKGSGVPLQARHFMIALGLDRSAWVYTRSHADNMNLVRRVGERRAAHYVLTQKGKNLLKSLQS